MTYDNEIVADGIEVLAEGIVQWMQRHCECERIAFVVYEGELMCVAGNGSQRLFDPIARSDAPGAIVDPNTLAQECNAVLGHDKMSWATVMRASGHVTFAASALDYIHGARVH